MNNHQQKQKEVIAKIEKQIQTGTLSVSTVSPVNDFVADPRVCLTSVHLPKEGLIEKLKKLIAPLQKISPQHYYYPPNSLHITIKNIRVINDPPHFTQNDRETAEKVFSTVIPKHSQFQVYFYRLLLFPNNLALIGTTDEELDAIILDLDKQLKNQGVADDKQYINNKYFFANITLARFSTPIDDMFIEKVNHLSHQMTFDPYAVDSVTLLSTNAVFYKPKIIHSWKLKNR